MTILPTSDGARIRLLFYVYAISSAAGHLYTRRGTVQSNRILFVRFFVPFSVSLGMKRNARETVRSIDPFRVPSPKHLARVRRRVAK